MKKLMILGAFLGFSSGLIVGAIQGASWADILWRSSLVCFASSFLFRWWGRAWLHALRQAQIERAGGSQLNHAPPASI